MSTDPDRVSKPCHSFGRVLVWDAPTRVFHWLMAACFVGAYLTANQDGWQEAHATLGLTMVGLVIFRILWGFAGTRYARFDVFLDGPEATVKYLLQLPHGWGKRYLGHSPIDGLLVLLTLLLTLAASASGWVTRSNSASGSVAATLHEGIAHAMLVIVGLHLVAVALGSWRSGENLTHSMFNGTKLGSADEAIQDARRNVAIALVAAVVAFWWYQWRSADTAAPPERPAPELGATSIIEN